MPETNAATPVRVVEETPAYWRVVFDYPPFNMVDDTMFQSLQDLLARMDASPTLRVVVFESAIPDFYLAHFDLTGKIEPRTIAASCTLAVQGDGSLSEGFSGTAIFEKRSTEVLGTLLEK